MRRYSPIIIIFLLTIPAVTGTLSFYALDSTADEQELVLYSGRSESLVGPLVEQFEERHGIKVRVRYGATTQLSIALHEEGRRSPADIFWAQDRGALDAMDSSGLLSTLSESIQALRPVSFQPYVGNWIATSGRARVLAYSPERVDKENLPVSVFDLTDAAWQGRVGWAPTNASFQSFVTSMRTQYGDAKTREWLSGMKSNQAQSYGSNVPILQGIASGEIDLGITNHYYLYRLKDADSEFPVEQTTFQKGDIGNLVNVAGIGILQSSSKQDNAEKFIRFVLSNESQVFFTEEIKEYPVMEGMAPASGLMDQESLMAYAPELHLDKQDDLQGTLQLMMEVGIL